MRRLWTALGGLLLLTAPAMVQAQFTFTTNADNTLTIASYTGVGAVVAIPSTTNGMTVTAIGTNAFANTLVTSVTMPDTVISIDDLAFDRCSKLTNVVMSDALVSIGNGAFGVCSSLANATIPVSVTNIGNGAFLFCSSLTSVSIPANVVAIGTSAFEDCTDLTNMDIANGVTSIGIDAFLECSSLTNVVIPDSVTNIGTFAFGFCSSLTSVVLPAGLGNIASGAFAVCGALTNVTIPSTVTDIGSNAFSGTSLSSLTIPSSVTSIEANAFSGTSLTNVMIPSTVTNIGAGAFIVCSDLTNITVSGQNLFYSSVNGLLFDKSHDTLIEFPAGLGGNYTIPGSVTSIGDNAFEDSGLTKVIIPTSVTNIGNGAFSGTSLTSVTIPASVVSIGNDAFIICPDLTNITVAGQNSFYTSSNGILFDISQTMLIEFPAGLGGSYTTPSSTTSIEDSAFAGSGLATVTISTGVTNIGADAFYDCTNLNAVFFEGNAPTTDPSAFTFDNNTIIYYLPGAKGWSSPFAGLPAVLAEILTWNNPSSIIYGAPLTSNQLNATADIPGSFTYTFTNGSVLNAGTNSLGVIFTPSNTMYYSIVADTVNLVVSPVPLTITANSTNKTYGQALNFAGTEFASSGLVNGDTVTAVTLTSSGAPSAATVAGSPYPIVPSAAQPASLNNNYIITYQNGALTVNPAGVTITSGITANNKTYDGTTTATLSFNNVVLSGVDNGDPVMLNTNGYIANFASASVGQGIAVIVSGLSLSGADAGNYTLTQPANLVANIISPIPPSLQILASKPNVVISWPTNGFNYVLNQAGSLSLPVTWSPVTNSITVNGTNNTVTINASSGVQYFELIGSE